MTSHRPRGSAIRDATIDDHAAFVRLFPELGVDDPVPSRERFGAEYVARSLVFDDGEVVGYALYDVLDGLGYIRHLITDPGRRRAGIGRALLAELRQRFVDAGAREWHLNVKPGNVAAIALYEACGMRAEHVTHVMRLPREAPSRTCQDASSAMIRSRRRCASASAWIVVGRFAGSGSPRCVMCAWISAARDGARSSAGSRKSFAERAPVIAVSRVHGVWPVNISNSTTALA